MLTAFLYHGEARTRAVTAAAVGAGREFLEDAKREYNSLSLLISAGETILSRAIAARRRAFLAA